MSYVIMRHADGAFVARSGSASSYTKDILKAQTYPTKEAAKLNACGNENVVDMAALIQ